MTLAAFQESDHPLARQLRHVHLGVERSERVTPSDAGWSVVFAPSQRAVRLLWKVAAQFIDVPSAEEALNLMASSLQVVAGLLQSYENDNAVLNLYVAVEALRDALRITRTELDRVPDDRWADLLPEFDECESVLTALLEHSPDSTQERTARLKAITGDDIERLRDAVREEHRRIRELSSEQQAAFLRAQTERAEAVSREIQGFQAQFRDAVREEHRRTRELASEHQEAFLRAQAERSEAVSREIQRIKEQYGDLSVRYSNSLADLTSQTNDSLLEIRRNATMEWDAFTTSLQQSHETRLHEITQSASDSLASLKRHELDAKNLIDVIGERGVTSGYRNAADAARRARLLWQSITVASMLGLIYLGVFVFLPSVGPDFSWPAFAVRVFVTLTVGVLAAFAAHQGDRYHHIEQANRRVELNLASIGPYLESLPAEKRDQIRALVAERLFVSASGDVPFDGHSPTSAADLVNASTIEALIRALAEKRGSGK